MEQLTNTKKWTALRFTALAVSVIFIGIGIYQNEHLAVLEKAVRICLECIGIG